MSVVGGKLKLKGGISLTSKKSSNVKSSVDTATEARAAIKKNSQSSDKNNEIESETGNESLKRKISNSDESGGLTAAQKSHREKKLKILERDLKKLTKTTYRERLDKFNLKLSKMTEHNDIPRISAAGNG